MRLSERRNYLTIITSCSSVVQHQQLIVQCDARQSDFLVHKSRSTFTVGGRRQLQPLTSLAIIITITLQQQ
jgi:hypothetical protein